MRFGLIVCGIGRSVFLRLSDAIAEKVNSHRGRDNYFFPNCRVNARSVNYVREAFPENKELAARHIDDFFCGNESVFSRIKAVRILLESKNLCWHNKYSPLIELENRSLVVARGSFLEGLAARR
jgi:hypothetical protein